MAEEAEESEEASSPIQGVQRVYICDCLITLYPIRKLLAKLDINLQSMCVDIKSYQVNALLERERNWMMKINRNLSHSYRIFYTPR